MSPFRIGNAVLAVIFALLSFYFFFIAEDNTSTPSTNIVDNTNKTSGISSGVTTSISISQ